MAYKGILGAIIGDIVGSRFEWHNYKGKDFELFTNSCKFTDDTAMTIAVGKALADCNGHYENLSYDVVKSMQKIGRQYAYCGYGGSFKAWLKSDNPEPYNSWGNGSAMRVSACAYFANSLAEVKDLSYKVTAVTHNHPEGIKGAEATAVAAYLAHTGVEKEKIREYITKNYYPLNFKLDDIRDEYCFHVSCQKSVPQALEAFFEADNYEDTLRNAISIGGDSDTIGAIAGAVAGAYYSIPEDIKSQGFTYLDDNLRNIVNEIDSKAQEKSLLIQTQMAQKNIKDL